MVYKYITNTNYLAEKDVVIIPTHEAELLKIDNEIGEIGELSEADSVKIAGGTVLTK